jgi:predicted acylesterase/phospholipase RssA
MKKTFLLLLSSMVLYAQAYSQSNASGSGLSSAAVTAQMKSDSKALMANNGTGNVLTASITNQVAGPLSLTADQKKSMNNALFAFFTEKAAFLNLQKTDNASYQQQQNGLLTNFMTTLAGFLSADQSNKFIALKPAGSNRSNLLTIVFY